MVTDRNMRGKQVSRGLFQDDIRKSTDKAASGFAASEEKHERHVSSISASNEAKVTGEAATALRGIVGLMA